MVDEFMLESIYTKRINKIMEDRVCREVTYHDGSKQIVYTSRVIHPNLRKGDGKIKSIIQVNKYEGKSINNSNGSGLIVT